MGKKNLITNDLHLMKGRLDLNALVLSTILEKIQETQPSYLTIAGDIFHEKDLTYETVKEQFKNFILEVLSYSYIESIYLAVGNHDWCIEHTLHSLNYLEGLSDRLFIVSGSLMITDKVGIMAYARTEERFKECFEFVKESRALIGHFAFNNFDLGQGTEEVDLWCDPEKIASGKLVKLYSGHWHKYQRKIVNGVEITYIGSPTTVSRGESNQKKYVLLLDMDTLEDELIETGLTMHKDFRIKAGDDFPELPQGEVDMGVSFLVYVEGTIEQLANLKRPVGYRARIEPVITSSREKREQIDAYSGERNIIQAYMKKKEKNIEDLIKSLEPEVSEEDLKKEKERWFTQALRTVNSN